MEAIAMERLLSGWKLPADAKREIVEWGKVDAQLDRLCTEAHPDHIRRALRVAREAFASSGDPSDFAAIRPAEDEAHRRLSGCQRDLAQLSDARRTGAQKLLPLIRTLHASITEAVKVVFETELAATCTRLERFGLAGRPGPVELSIEQSLAELNFALKYIEGDVNSERTRNWLALVGLEVQALEVVE
ncbi:MAG: hypothetical protein ACYDC1_21950 [Limisphaerales bacterium]